MCEVVRDGGMGRGARSVVIDSSIKELSRITIMARRENGRPMIDYAILLCSHCACIDVQLSWLVYFGSLLLGAEIFRKLASTNCYLCLCNNTFCLIKNRASTSDLSNDTKKKKLNTIAVNENKQICLKQFL